LLNSVGLSSSLADSQNLILPGSKSNLKGKPMKRKTLRSMALAVSLIALLGVNAGLQWSLDFVGLKPITRPATLVADGPEEIPPSAVLVADGPEEIPPVAVLVADGPEEIPPSAILVADGPEEIPPAGVLVADGPEEIPPSGVLVADGPEEIPPAARIA
jgi:hypothetical protein